MLAVLLPAARLDAVKFAIISAAQSSGLIRAMHSSVTLYWHNRVVFWRCCVHSAAAGDTPVPTRQMHNLSCAAVVVAKYSACMALVTTKAGVVVACCSDSSNRAACHSSCCICDHVLHEYVACNGTTALDCTAFDAAAAAAACSIRSHSHGPSAPLGTRPMHMLHTCWSTLLHALH